LRLIARSTFEKLYRTTNCDQIINKRNGREDQYEILENRRNYRTSRISIPWRPEFSWYIMPVAASGPEKEYQKEMFHAAETVLPKKHQDRIRFQHWEIQEHQVNLDAYIRPIKGTADQ
jgi:hypothetical protein